MPLFKYLIKYHYFGITKENPFPKKELNEEQIENNMDEFYNIIGRYFDDNDEVEIERYEDGSVGILTNIIREECNRRVKRCSDDFDLFSQNITVEDKA